MKKNISNIIDKINRIDDYTIEYKNLSINMEIPSFAYTNWGMHFARIKDYDTAIEKLKTAASMSYKNPKPYISLGVIYAKLKEYEKAQEVLREALKLDSQNSYAHSVLGSILVAQNKFDEAEDFLKNAIKLAPKESEIYLNYGVLYAKQQKKTKAIEMLNKAKFYNSANPHIYFLLGVMYFETDKISEAFLEFQTLEKFFPNYKNLNYYFALCHKKEKNYNAVLEYGTRALEEDDKNPMIYILLAENYLSMQQNDNCLKTFQNGQDKGINDFEFFLSWGISLINSNKLDEAKEKINMALGKKENNSNALYRLGDCYYRGKNYDKAIELFNAALDSDSENDLALSGIAFTLYSKKDYENAINSFFKAINIAPDKKYLYFYIANCYYRIGKTKKSAEYYEKTLEYYPNHTEALINYSIILLMLNNEKEAMRKIRKAYQTDRTSEKILLIYALISYRNGLYNEAIEKTNSILNNTPDNTDAKLIKCHALIGKRYANEALNLILSLPKELQEYSIFLYLAYCSYKILVENEPTNYNENMLKSYEKRLEEMKQDTNEDKSQISEYFESTLNINKG